MDVYKINRWIDRYKKIQRYVDRQKYRDMQIDRNIEIDIQIYRDRYTEIQRRVDRFFKAAIKLKGIDRQRELLGQKDHDFSMIGPPQAQTKKKWSLANYYLFKCI